MKNIIASMMLLVSLVARGQESVPVFKEAFEGMFSIEEPVFIPQNTPPPPVPLDGGLVALLAAGGAVAYKKYRSKRSNRPGTKGR